MTTQLLRPSAWFHQVAWRHFSRVQPSAGVTWRRCSVWCSGHPIWCLHLTFDCCHVSYWGSVVNRTISALQLFDYFFFSQVDSLEYPFWIHWNTQHGMEPKIVCCICSSMFRSFAGYIQIWAYEGACFFWWPEDSFCVCATLSLGHLVAWRPIVSCLEEVLRGTRHTRYDPTYHWNWAS